MATRSFGGGFLILSLIAVGVPVTVGCATPQVSADGLPLKRVIVYRNGVGYFERTGRVESHEVKFRVRGSEVGDFLATMAVIEKGGSSVKSASFPLKVEEEDDELLPDDGNGPFLRPLVPPKKKDPNKLVNVLLSLDGKRHDLSVGYIAETPVWRPSYRLVIHKDSADLQAWGIVQNLSGEDWNSVSLSLVAGAPLSFAATLGTPVIPPRPEVSDRGEVIGAMPGSETSLAQGGLADRDRDGIVDREDKCPDYPGTRSAGGCPDVPDAKPSAAPVTMADQRAVVTANKMKTKNEAQKSSGGRAAASRRPSAAGGKGGKKRDAPMEASIDGDESGYPGGMPMPAPSVAASAYAPDAPPPPPPPPPGPSGPRDLSALAAVAIEGSSTRYDIPNRVSVPDKSATMVMLISQRVPGESSFLFAPSFGVPDSQSHPFRVARFTNKTAGLLERGPIAVFEDGAFLGQGIVDPLPPDATATVPFALERAIALELTTKGGEQGARVAKVEAGSLYIDRDWSQVTRYLVKNGSDKPVRVFVKHNRRPGTKLFEPPKDTDDNVGTATALVPVPVGAQTSGEVSIDERSTTTREVDWLSPLADEAMKAYFIDPKANAVAVVELKKAWEIRAVLLKAAEEEHKLRDEQRELERSTDETRRNIVSLEKNTAAAALRKQLSDRLAASAIRLNEITKRLVEVGLIINEQRVRFQEIVRGIKVGQSAKAP